MTKITLEDGQTISFESRRGFIWITLTDEKGNEISHTPASLDEFETFMQELDGEFKESLG